MNSYYRSTVFDNLPSEINRLFICSEYGWRDYHYILHSCYAQPDASYWRQVAYEITRNITGFVMLTLCVLAMVVSLTLAANGIIWIITQAVKGAYNAVTTPIPAVHPGVRSGIKHKSPQRS